MILDRILEVKRAEVDELRRRSPLSALKDAAVAQDPPRGLARALGAAGPVRIMAEVKRRSPSKGVLRAEFDPVELARAYERGGAAAVSVLTDGPFFGGSLEHLAAVRQAVSLPVLRKDFVIDPLQVYEARAWGADGVLLIAAALERPVLVDLLALVRELGMDGLVEVHTAWELETALDAGVDFIGINNRDLRTFETSLAVSQQLAPRVPAGITVVSESGIAGRSDIERLAASGVDAVLVGETLVRSLSPETAVASLNGVPRPGRASQAVAP
ncbi:MAG: indole-3-glycerol phosphate synthase TrpC [Firmicutes bacterium]|nr:indole-3-glycerol phosphate synthase TrpC [Bacillota bacterium]